MNTPDETNQNTENLPTEAPTSPETPEAKKPYTGKPRGFAAMSADKVKEIASKGGKAAHVAGTAHRFTTDEARAAGQKGGNAPHVSRGTQGKGKKDEGAES